MALMRARDIRDKLRGKIDPELLQTLEIMCEQTQENKQSIKQAVSLLLRFQDVLIDFGTALAAIGGKVMSVEKQDVEHLVAPTVPDDGTTH